jgi:hypothetical protein
MRLRNILRAHGNNHSSSDRACVLFHTPQGREMTKSNGQSGRAISKIRNTGTASFRNMEHQNTKILNLLKIRGEKITGGCEIISGKIIL